MKATRIKEYAYLAIYLVTQEYGGPEEGGWYYYQGELLNKPKMFDISNESQEEALYQLKERLQKRLDNVYDINKRQLSSVLSEGQIRGEIWRNEIPPKSYPTESQHYE